MRNTKILFLNQMSIFYPCNNQISLRPQLILPQSRHPPIPSIVSKYAMLSYQIAVNKKVLSDFFAPLGEIVGEEPPIRFCSFRDQISTIWK